MTGKTVTYKNGGTEIRINTNTLPRHGEKESGVYLQITSQPPDAGYLFP